MLLQKIGLSCANQEPKRDRFQGGRARYRGAFNKVGAMRGFSVRWPTAYAKAEETTSSSAHETTAPQQPPRRRRPCQGHTVCVLSRTSRCYFVFTRRARRERASCTASSVPLLWPSRCSTRRVCVSVLYRSMVSGRERRFVASRRCWSRRPLSSRCSTRAQLHRGVSWLSWGCCWLRRAHTSASLTCWRLGTCSFFEITFPSLGTVEIGCCTHCHPCTFARICVWRRARLSTSCLVWAWPRLILFIRRPDGRNCPSV